MRASSELQSGALREVYCCGEPGSALSGGYAPFSAKAEGSSIVDEPGEGTGGLDPVRENERRKTGGF